MGLEIPLVSVFMIFYGSIPSDIDGHQHAIHCLAKWIGCLRAGLRCRVFHWWERKVAVVPMTGEIVLHVLIYVSHLFIDPLQSCVSVLFLNVML